MGAPIADPKIALKFMLAGNAVVTLVSLQSGNRYTFKIVESEKRNPTDPDTWFVKLLNGPNNTCDYAYIGIIRNNCFVWTSKSHVTKNAPSVVAVTYVLRCLTKNDMTNFQVWHEDHCGRCNRELTDPTSIAIGFGPECREMVGVAAIMVSGTPAPQRNKNFDGSVRQPKTKAAKDAARYERIKEFHDSHDDASDEMYVCLAGERGITVSDLAWFSERQKNDPDYQRPLGMSSLIDAEIRRRIEEYKANAPENYYHDGELSEEEAFKVAVNKFRVEVEREGRR